ncbi:hypothetical protein E2C01_036225 [Portunus trituberculatus]|uniref:Uncharacterized protein n=1 Tax=Portunus trituberculatus TaxID=210409 RepID=A0A5B7F856_PORTR|nr:hypothetical protein [Portunus trituberculatus]
MAKHPLSAARKAAFCWAGFQKGFSGGGGGGGGGDAGAGGDDDGSGGRRCGVSSALRHLSSQISTNHLSLRNDSRVSTDVLLFDTSL